MSNDLGFWSVCVIRKEAIGAWVFRKVTIGVVKRIDRFVKDWMVVSDNEIDSFIPFTSIQLIF